MSQGEPIHAKDHDVLLEKSGWKYGLPKSVEYEGILRLGTGDAQATGA